MNVRTEVLQHIAQVADEHNRKLAPLGDDLPLMQSGLDSLCLAVVIAHLEDSLGTDPFSALNGSPFPVTVGDFIRLYEDALR